MVERKTIIRSRRASQRVGSGGLLGAGSLGATAVECDLLSSVHCARDYASPTRHPYAYLGLACCFLNIRSIEQITDQLFIPPFFAHALHIRASLAADEPNVQDEPRPWLARAVLLGARIVTAMVVGSGALLGRSFMYRCMAESCSNHTSLRPCRLKPSGNLPQPLEWLLLLPQYSADGRQMPNHWAHAP
jgi:hypothetical protein